jgi:hypothetical protein
VRARTAVFAALSTIVTALLVLPATPVAAAVTLLGAPNDGEDPGSGLTVLQTIGIFVVIPVLIFMTIVVLVLAPSAARGPRYRPGLGWWAAPVWFNGPDDAERAVRESAETRSLGGGASARW